MHRKHILIAATLAAVAIPAAAQQAPRWYVGIGAGQSRTSDDLVSNRESTVVNGHATSSDFDSTDGSWKIFAGWQANEWLGLEAYYADLGQTHLVTNTLSVDQLSGTFDMKRKVDGVGIDAIARGPFAPGFSAFIRAGAFASRTRADASVSGGLVFTDDPTVVSRSNTANKTVAHYGVGAEWAFQPNAALRLEWERFDSVGKAFAVGGTGTTGEADTDLVSLSILMRF